MRGPAVVVVAQAELGALLAVCIDALNPGGKSRPGVYDVPEWAERTAREDRCRDAVELALADLVTRSGRGTLTPDAMRRARLQITAALIHRAR